MKEATEEETLDRLLVIKAARVMEPKLKVTVLSITVTFYLLETFPMMFLFQLYPHSKNYFFFKDNNGTLIGKMSNGGNAKRNIGSVIGDRGNTSNGGKVQSK